MMVMTEKSVLPAADGQTASVLTVQLKDSANRVLPNQLVEFSTDDSGVVLVPVGDTPLASTLTDVAGKAQVRIELGSSAEARLNRTVTVTAKSGSVTRSMAIAVSGFKLTLSGPDTLNGSSSGDFTVAALDGAGLPVANLDLTASFNGGALAASSVKTGLNGQAVIRVTAGASAANATLSVSGLGMSPISRTVRVLSSQTPFQIVAPSSPWVVGVNREETIKVQYLSLIHI